MAKTHAMLIDYKYCTGCYACQVSCAYEKELTQEEWGMQITQHGPVKIKGEVMWDYVPVPSSACDLCAERLEQGQVPACQLHCLAACIEVVPIEEVSAKLAEKGDKTVVFIP